MPLFKKCEEYVYIRELVDKGIYPYFHELESKQDIEVMMEGKRRIMLGSNNYLGLTVNQEVIDAGVEAMKKYGTGCSGSRFLNGTLDLHNKLERELADFLGTEDCVTFSTGFQSNLGIISAICGRQDYIFNDRENHASIYDGCKLSYAKVTRYRHNDMADLEKRLAETPIDAGKLIVTDGVFSMSGDICRLPDIAELAHKYKARVMVDDAHGLGVIGKGGRGTASYFGLEKEVDINNGHVLKVPCKPWRLHGGQRKGLRIRKAQFPPVHIQRIAYPRKLRHRARRAEGYTRASRNSGTPGRLGRILPRWPCCARRTHR